MKVAVSSMGTDLEAQIDPRFGRCANFIIVDTDDMRFEVFDNKSIALSGGAGIQSAQFMASKGAKVIITGSLGPNAVTALTAAGIQQVTGQTGTVRKAVEDYKTGKLTVSNAADASGMSGRNPRGAGMGRGGGRGMGGGGGMGGGRGMGQGRGRR